MKLAEGIKVIQSDYEGQYMDYQKGLLICPICGRKLKVCNPDGDLRCAVHCKCKTGNKCTVFRLNMGVYVYTYANGNQLIIY